jgi:hypothetical protein
LAAITSSPAAVAEMATDITSFNAQNAVDRTLARITFVTQRLRDRSASHVGSENVAIALRPSSPISNSSVESG